jgi:hypothetical protein
MEETKISFKPWWGADKKELTYAFNPKNNVTNEVKLLVKSVFENWSITTLKFKEAKTFNDSDINIVFVTIDGIGGFVGGVDSNYSSHIGTIYLDSDEQWILPSDNFNENGDVDLESVVMHQVGHVLGLEHSSVEEAIMYPIVLQEKKIKLVNQDDLQKISAIYHVKVNNGSSSSHSNRGDVACCGWKGHIVYGLVSGFIFVGLGIL